MKKRHELMKPFLLQLKEFEHGEKTLRRDLTELFDFVDGHAMVRINVAAQESIYEPLSCGAQIELRGDLYGYIEQLVYPLPAWQKVHLSFEGRGFCEEEKLRVDAIVRRHYRMILRDKRLDLHLNVVKTLRLFGIGALLLLLSFGLNRYDIGAFYTEVLSIAATFALWEAVDCLLIERHDLKVERWNAGQLALADIVFDVK